MNDMNSPGFDYVTRFGLVQADAAIQELQRLQPPTAKINVSDATASESGGDLGQLLVTRTGYEVINGLVVNSTMLTMAQQLILQTIR
jgi:hypothetical protein